MIVSFLHAWAAQYNTWLLNKLTPKGVVFSFSLPYIDFAPGQACPDLIYEPRECCIVALQQSLRQASKGCGTFKRVALQQLTLAVFVLMLSCCYAYIAGRSGTFVCTFCCLLALSIMPQIGILLHSFRTAAITEACCEACWTSILQHLHSTCKLA